MRFLPVCIPPKSHNKATPMLKNDLFVFSLESCPNHSIYPGFGRSRKPSSSNILSAPPPVCSFLIQLLIKCEGKLRSPGSMGPPLIRIACDSIVNRNVDNIIALLAPSAVPVPSILFNVLTSC